MRIIEQSLKNLPDTVLIYIWSTLLAVLRDEKVIPFIEVLMNHETFTLWQRAELMHQLQRTIFTNGLAVDEKDEYRRNDRIYNSIMDKIREEKKKTFSYIPLAKRQKKVVIILNQLVGRQHATTRIILQTKEYLEAFGYEVKVYVGFMPNENSGIMWYKQCIWNNFMERQGYFKCNVENGRIEGYNARIENDNFEKNLEDTAELIYREAPEWVLEVGEETFLADLCREFTTVVTRGCVRTIPVTNAPIIVLASDYTLEEEQRYQNWLKPYQQFVEVKHSLFRMKQHPEETAEKALEESLRKDGIVLSDEEFLEVLDGVKPMIYCIMSYYREKAVKVILEAGITLEVFGDSWKKSPFGDSPYLRIHEAVDMRESLEVMGKSLISFNVMAWHKDGFTERIANSMLQHSVVLTDESTYLKEQFTDGKDILMYRLNELYKIQELLADYLEGAGRDNLQMIAENAYRKAKENYTWEQSAKKLLAFIDEIDAKERKCSEK